MGTRGWGVQEVEHIQVGTFLFELAGEIVTNGELIERNHLIHKLLGFPKNLYPSTRCLLMCSSYGQ